MGSDADDAAVLQHRDAVGQRHGRRAVGDDQCRGGREDAPERCLDEGFGVDVERAERVVEHEHRGPSGDRPGKGQALALPAGEAESFFADRRVDAVGELVGEVRLRDLERFVQDRVTLGAPRIEVVTAEQHVIAHARREQRRVFERHRDVTAQFVQPQVAHVDAVDLDRALGHVVEACGQRREGRLARSGEPYQGHRLARAQHQIDAVEEVALGGRSILIPEVGASERELSAWLRELDGILGIDDVVLLVEHLEDAIGRGAGVDEEREQEAERFDRPAQRRRHREEGEQLADRQLVLGGEPDTGEQAQRERDHRHDLEPEPQHADLAGLLQLGAAQGLDLRAELLQGVLAAAEGLEHADAVHALLDRGGEVAGLVLAHAREGPVGALEPIAEPPQRNRHDEEDHPEQPVPLEQQHRADEDREHVDHEQDAAECQPAADQVDVLHHAAEELPRLPPVVERDRQALEAPVELLTDLVLHARGGGQHEGAAQVHEQRLEHAEEEHSHRGPHDQGDVARGDRPVDDGLQHERNHQGDERRAERREEAEDEAAHHRTGEGDQTRERLRCGQTLGSGGSGSHDPCGMSGADGAEVVRARCDARAGARWATKTMGRLKNENAADAGDMPAELKSGVRAS